MGYEFVKDRRLKNLREESMRIRKESTRVIYGFLDGKPPKSTQIANFSDPRKCTILGVNSVWLFTALLLVFTALSPIMVTVTGFTMFPQNGFVIGNFQGLRESFACILINVVPIPQPIFWNHWFSAGKLHLHSRGNERLRFPNKYLITSTAPASSHRSPRAWKGAYVASQGWNNSRSTTSVAGGVMHFESELQRAQATTRSGMTGFSQDQNHWKLRNTWPNQWRWAFLNEIFHWSCKLFSETHRIGPQWTMEVSEEYIYIYMGITSCKHLIQRWHVEKYCDPATKTLADSVSIEHFLYISCVQLYRSKCPLGTWKCACPHGISYGHTFL